MKAFFLSRLFREKVLLLAFVLLIAATWFSNVMGRAGKFSREFKLTSAELAEQRSWLNQREKIEATAKAAVEHLDPAKTYDGIRLQREIGAILDRCGIKNYNTDNAVPERASQLTMYFMRVEIRGVDWAALKRFYLELVKQNPYICIDQFRITATNNMHNASLRVASPVPESAR
ncbi:MAG: hypothetical protein QM790_13125 [Nibricoccus sp.]